MVVVCPSKSQHPHYWARAPQFVPQAFIGKSRGQPLNLQQFDHSFRSLRTCITQQSAAGEAGSLHHGNQVCHVFYLPAILEANWDLVSYLILLSRQGKVVSSPAIPQQFPSSSQPLPSSSTTKLTQPFAQRLAKWFTTLSPKDKAKIVKDVSQLVLARRTRMCNFLEYKGGWLGVPWVSEHSSSLTFLKTRKSSIADMRPSSSLPAAPPRITS